MQPSPSYIIIIKQIKYFILLGQLLIFLLRLLVQRIFSLYLGLVMLQILLSSIISFKSNSSIQSKMYLILNFVLVYLMGINFVQQMNNNQINIGMVVKDRFVVNYMVVGYPLQAIFRILTMLLVWRIYQAQMYLKEENGDWIQTQQEIPTPDRRTGIRIRRNSINFQITGRVDSNSNSRVSAINRSHRDLASSRNELPPQNNLYIQNLNLNLNSNRISRIQNRNLINEPIINSHNRIHSLGQGYRNFQNLQHINVGNQNVGRNQFQDRNIEYR